MSSAPLSLPAASGLRAVPRPSAADVLGMGDFVVVAAPPGGTVATVSLKGVQFNLH